MQLIQPPFNLATTHPAVLVKPWYHADLFRQGILVNRGRSYDITTHKTLSSNVTSALTRMWTMGCVLGFLDGVGGKSSVLSFAPSGLTPSPIPPRQSRSNVSRLQLCVSPGSAALLVVLFPVWRRSRPRWSFSVRREAQYHLYKLSRRLPSRSLSTQKYV